MEAADRLYSPKQAALAAHVSRATILRRIADGTIAATKRGTHWRIKQADLDSYRAAVLEQTAAMMADDW
ncbi:MAG: helix-turn-helix domain-containing protein [Propionibacteriaceae bacterium]|nr:helix-turn-helix domain-containing protein [Propionibacteriaceae bacterium]